MTNCFRWVVRLLLVSYICLEAYENLNTVKETSVRWAASMNKFENALKNKTGF